MIETESTKQRVRSHRLHIEVAAAGLTMCLYGRRPPIAEFACYKEAGGQAAGACAVLTVDRARLPGRHSRPLRMWD